MVNNSQARQEVNTASKEALGKETRLGHGKGIQAEEIARTQVQKRELEGLAQEEKNVGIWSEHNM